MGSGNQGEKILQAHEEGGGGPQGGARDRGRSHLGTLKGVSRRIMQASRVVSRWFRRFRSDFAANFTVVSQDFTVISQGFTCASHVKCVK